MRFTLSPPSQKRTEAQKLAWDRPSVSKIKEKRWAGQCHTNNCKHLQRCSATLSLYHKFTCVEQTSLVNLRRAQMPRLPTVGDKFVAKKFCAGLTPLVVAIGTHFAKLMLIIATVLRCHGFILTYLGDRWSRLFHAFCGGITVIMVGSPWCCSALFSNQLIERLVV